jgi:hypothetical protein
MHSVRTARDVGRPVVIGTDRDLEEPYRQANLIFQRRHAVDAAGVPERV